MSTDLEISNLAEELLRDIIELWLNIRGFSIAGQWMEVYKHKSTTTKKAKSLRKTLKRKGASSTSKKTKQTSLKKALKESINDS